MGGRTRRLPTKARRALIAVLAILSLGLQACAATPTEPELTLEDLRAQFKILLTDTGSTGAASSQGMQWTTSSFGTEIQHIPLPALDEIAVPAPGTPGIFNWPVVEDVDIQPQHSGSEIRLSYPTVSEALWPTLAAGPPEDDGSPALVFGVAWVIYRVQGGGWLAETVEWLRAPEERGGTVIPLEHLTEGTPAADDPVAFFLAGPSRHSPDLPEYQRRSVPRWFRWSDFAPWEGLATPPPEPEPEVPTQAEVYITGFFTELSNGTVVSFNEELGGIDLLSLRNQTVEAVDAQILAGTYSYVAFSVDEARSFVVVNGEVLPLSVPTGEVRVEGPFVVAPDSATSVTLDFDAENSLVQTADGSWLLQPQVTAVVSSES
ncbi:MAG: DUF4382 domain-containing protein [Acidobacteria bacterium]|nr:DUF4382 domain-containing protein [Acidobacteriota bacterium]